MYWQRYLKKKILRISRARARATRDDVLGIVFLFLRIVFLFDGSILIKCVIKIQVKTPLIDSVHSPLSIGATLNSPLEIKNALRKK